MEGLFFYLTFVTSFGKLYKDKAQELQADDDLNTNFVKSLAEVAQEILQQLTKHLFKVAQ